MASLQFKLLWFAMMHARRSLKKAGNHYQASQREFQAAPTPPNEREVGRIA